MPNNDSSSLNLEHPKRVVLLLQGGGALGAYQVGAYRALEAACKQANNKVEWVGGISIGAVNAAVIAGPMGGHPVTELEQLWDEILSPHTRRSTIAASGRVCRHSFAPVGSRRSSRNIGAGRGWRSIPSVSRISSARAS